MQMDGISGNSYASGKICWSTVIGSSSIAVGHSCISWNEDVVQCVQYCDEICGAVGSKGGKVMKHPGY